MYHSLRLSTIAWMKEWGVPISLCLGSFAMLWSAHPPRQTPELAYIFLLPILIWFYFRPTLSKVLVCSLFIGWIYQIAMVGWMRHVSLGGMCAATFLLSCYNAIWFLFARVWLKHFTSSNLPIRFLIIIGLSCLWVAIEWLRTLFTLGFPWCPLSVTQWERPVLLQTASFAGAWTISFFLVFFNLCIGSYLHHLFIRRRLAKGFVSRSFCPELYLGLLLLALMVYPYFSKRETLHNKDKKTLRVGICQPYLLNKWEEGSATKHKQILRKQTEFLSIIQPDLILWPEASTPYPINLDRLWVEDLAKKTGVPILVGSVVREEDASYNAMVYVDPIEGMNPEWYAKQVLVPFGEYVPWPFHWVPGLEKMVGPVGNFSSGDRTLLYDLPIREENSISFVRAGLMVCYEDIFPFIPRKAVRMGAEVLFVSTNDAWFKEEGCAEQHAAHSVLRAVENNIPVIRCGNAGWSGWIDEYGFIQDVLLDQHNRVYFEGAAVIEVKLPSKERIPKTGTLGDKFAYFCTLLFVGISLYLQFGRKLSVSKES